MRAIFVGGAGRSGTTMLGSMLGAHSSCLAVPESQFKVALLARADMDGDVDVAPALGQVRRDGRFRRLWGLELDGLEERLGARAPARAVVEAIVREWGARTGTPDPAVWVDQTPSNVRYAATLAGAFPGARVVHLVRDGRAVAASILRMDWGPATPDRAARFWLLNLAFGLAAETSPELGSLTTRIHYEPLVADPETALRALCARLDIEFEPAMAEQGSLRPSAYTASIHEHVGAAPRPERIDAWRSELSPRDVELFESVARDALVMLGYQPEYGLRARAPTRGEALAASVRTVVGRRVKRVRRLRRRVAAR